MFKSKLQELCHDKSWELPKYATTKEGLDHCPQFKASVVVNGAMYFTPVFSKSSKEAQNLVAEIAYQQLAGPSNASPNSLVSISPKGCQKTQGNGSVQSSPLVRTNAPIVDDKKHEDKARICKNQLQMYAQKRNLDLPVYISEREGPPHALRFKCKVTVDGKSYESQDYFCTIKDAEAAAAKVALMSLSPDGLEEENKGIFKNLLQELAQKTYSCLPEYNTISSGPSHSPVFISTVEIKEESFTGQEAKSKKLAELYASKVAYCALKERSHPKGSGSTDVPGILEGSQSSNQISLTMDESKVENLPFELESFSAPVPQNQYPSMLGARENNEPCVNPNASSPLKKVKVFHRAENIKLPPGANIVHQDDKWVAVTIDSIQNNA